MQSNVANDGAVTARDGGTVELFGITVTGGTVNLDSAGATTTLEIEGSVTLTGGTVAMTDNANNKIVSNGSAATLTNHDSISGGSGTIGDANLTLLNYADIAALSSLGELILKASAITNESGATLEAKAGGTLEIWSPVTNFDATSGIVARDGRTVEPVGDTVTGGTIALNAPPAAPHLQTQPTV